MPAERPRSAFVLACPHEHSAATLQGNRWKGMLTTVKSTHDPCIRAARIMQETGRKAARTLQKTCARLTRFPPRRLSPGERLHGRGSYAAGNRRTNVVPAPSALSTSMVP